MKDNMLKIKTFMEVDKELTSRTAKIADSVRNTSTYDLEASKFIIDVANEV